MIVCRPLIIYGKRLITIQSTVDLGKQMKSLNDKKQFRQALELFDKHKQNNILTCSTLTITQVLKACAQIKDVERGQNIHKLIPSRIKSDYYILSSLIHFYMQCGNVTSAQLLFDKSKKKTLSMYGSMMKGYIKNNQANKAIDLFNRIKNPDEIIITFLFNACAQIKSNEALNLIRNVSEQLPKSFYSDSYLVTSLFDAFIKCEDCSSAEVLLEKMKTSVISYGNLMSGFIKENNYLKILNLFNKMKIDGIQADIVIYLCVIKALSEIGDYSTSKSIVEQILDIFLLDNRLQTALVDMWAKIGCIDHAEEIFEKISQPDHVGYAAMINCYGLKGQGIEAIKIFRQMPSQFINEVSYVCLLTACSHSGLAEEARSIFTNVPTKTEKIYTAMSCRASLFEEAQNLIDEFERDHPPSPHIYTEKVHDRMKKLFPQLTDSLIPASILLANVYASTGEIGKASNIRIQLSKSGVKKQVGVSWTTVNGQYFQFRAHDQSHPRFEEIYNEVEKTSAELISHGHQQDSSWVTRPINQDETVTSVLCGHSERLAIAWNFVVNPNATRIQVTENLRICGNCHQAIKLIAAIRQCEIIIRDANRIHHFHTNGQCSCKDYF
ncbi:hypothetical protein I4U23_011858 [Adineta vaga]|nr:hypothetical protein I4U23_011858 [Adineta vaga]